MNHPKTKIMRIRGYGGYYYVPVEIDPKTRSQRRLSLYLSLVSALVLGLYAFGVFDALAGLL